MATATAPIKVPPSSMGSGAAMAALAKPKPSPVAGKGSVQPKAATSAPSSPPSYLPETAPTRPVTPLPPLSSSQTNMLKQIAGIALNEANPVDPGQVTKGQQQVLSAWQANANSDYSQYMLDRGFTAVAQDPGALFNEQMLVAQAQWSAMDNKGALQAMGLSAKDWDEYQKLEEKEHKRKMGLIMGLVETVAGAAITYFSGGTLASVGVGMMASGASSMANS